MAQTKGARGMTRIIFIYGLISGAVVCAGILLTFLLPNAHGSVWLGYLIMLVALSSILVGVKQYRDDIQGGVIGFWKALAVGVGIAAMAGVAYVIVWEAYLAVTHYTFTDVYIKSVLAAKRAAHVSGADYQKTVAEMNEFRVQYASPLFRVPMTFIEIFPVGVLVALASAPLLRNSRFLPKRAAG
jgi:Protein of unknown function (DUF4199)